MTNTKYQRAISIYTGHKGDTSLSAVWNQIPTSLKESLTGKQLGEIMNLINHTYHTGRASAGAEKIDTNAVYVDGKGIIELTK